MLGFGIFEEIKEGRPVPLGQLAAINEWTQSKDVFSIAWTNRMYEVQMPSLAHRLFEQACRDLSDPELLADVPFNSSSPKARMAIVDLLRLATMESNARNRTEALRVACQRWDTMQRCNDSEGLAEFNRILADLLGLGEHSLGIAASQGWISTVVGLWKAAVLKRELESME